MGPYYINALQITYLRPMGFFKTLISAECRMKILIPQIIEIKNMYIISEMHTKKSIKLWRGVEAGGIQNK